MKKKFATCFLLLLLTVFCAAMPGGLDSVFEKNRQKPPKFSIRYGTTPGNVESPPFLRQIYGSQKVHYYNTPYFSPTRFAIDEPDNFLQIQIRRNERFAYSFLLMKQKIDPNQVGFKLEAPTAIEAGLSFKQAIYSKRWFDLSADFSGSFGVALADAKFPDRPGETVDKPWLTLSGYSPVGYGATMIARLDAVFFKNFALFVAGNLHHYQGTSVKTSIGKQRIKYLGSAEMTVGVGFNFGNK